MNNEVRDKLVELSQNSKFNGEKSEKLLERISDTFWEMEQLSYEKNGTLRGCLKLPEMSLNTIRYVLAVESEIRHRKKVLAELFGYSSDEMAGNNTEFTERTRAYVRDFGYDSSVQLKNLRRLEFVWGDFNLEPLNNLSHLNSLKVVLGNVNVSSNSDINEIPKLELVTGDFNCKSKRLQKSVN